VSRGAARTRAAAARVVRSVVHEGRSLSRLLPAAETEFEAPRDRALFKALVFGTVRFYPRYRQLLKRLLDRPLRKRAALLEALLCVGLFQLDQLRMPAHAAVAETVNAVRAGPERGAAGLANAVLRRFQRERDQLYAALADDDTFRYAIDGWWLQRWQCDWPDDWRRLAQAMNEQAPMWLRVNRVRTTTAAWCARLAEHSDVGTRLLAGADQAVCLQQPMDVHHLPGFAAGDVSVQDAAAQLAAPLVDARNGMRVLDACAAPGGKSAHLLERTPGIELVSLDDSAERLAQVDETLERLRLAGAPGSRRLAADAADLAAWWDGRPFDRVLLDAPCSASGVIRRHPDIKLLRSDDDLIALAATQRRLLQALWQTVAPGGRLVYATCSVFTAENDGIVAEFGTRAGDLQVEPLSLPYGRKSVAGLKIMPGEDAMDGFYYASLRKLPRAGDGAASG
jgi:16S rRNA (cytosine967-C5)-methyltransferase